MAALKAPFPAFGGKSRVADLAWSRFGEVRNYVEPFCFSAAMLLLRPDEPQIETINDMNAYVANFWRAIQHDPEAVACHADWPVNETDMHARHAWLVRSHEAALKLQEVRDNPEAFDVKIAGWWCWGACMWIGSGWCDEQIPHMSNAGQGVHGNDELTNCERRTIWLADWFTRLADRLRAVRVCCGHWNRVCDSDSTLTGLGLTGIFLDPPYRKKLKCGKKNRAAHIYANDKLQDVDGLCDEVQAWCLKWGDNPQIRIALCGLEGEYPEIEAAGWDCVEWKSQGGYGNRNKDNENAARERIWFSPACLTKPREVQPLLL